MNNERTLYKTVIISDLHLGIKDSKVRELTDFLKQHPCKKLILNGDIIDGWRLQKNARWKRKHTRFIKYLIKISSRTKIIYIRGNHDDFLNHIIPIGFANLRIVSNATVESNNKKYLVVHGDVFDKITRYMVWISKFGASSYDILLSINRIYNHWRTRRGLKYESISQGAKANVKFVTNLIGNFEKKAVTMAKNLGYDGIICGHIHTPADKMINGIHYLNAGDWVETMSGLVEDFDGNWQIKYCHELQTEPETSTEEQLASVSEKTEMEPQAKDSELIPDDFAELQKHRNHTLSKLRKLSAVEQNC